MASTVDICNLALARLGDDATIASIDPPEGSAQAEHCARFYPIARDSLLEMPGTSWKFATRRAILAQRSVESFSWQFAYAEPADALRIIAVHPQTAATDDASQPFETQAAEDGTPLILSDQPQANAVYVARVTDSVRFPPLFIDALSWLLASHLAGPVVKGDAGATMAKSCYQVFLAALSQAQQSDASQRHVSPAHTPSWIGAR